MPEYADSILLARVFTTDTGQPQAEAVAVKGRRILFVGKQADADRWKGPETRFIDGRGHTLLPGFIDSHFHLLHGSEELGNIQLYDVQNMDGLSQAIRSYAAENTNNPSCLGSV